MVRRPIWCQCKKHSWTRSNLKWAWETDTTIRCSNDECEREIEPHAIEEILLKIGEIQIDEEEDSDA